MTLETSEGVYPLRYAVIVPTLNQSRKLRQCLDHLSKLDFSPDSFEVLVIDNGSTDDTKHVVDSFKDKISCLRYFFSDIPGLHTGRNLGLEKARGEILCYIDDDSLVTKGWLRGIHISFSNKDVVLVGGPCLPEYEIDPPVWLSQFWSDTNVGRCLGSLSLLDFGEQVKSISPYCVFGCNFNIQKDILLRLGGFHPDAMPTELLRFRGDGETAVSRKLIDMGRNALYCPDARIYHLVPASRMTKEYFCHRAYIVGISHSFTQIRREHGLDTELAKSREDNRSQINIGSINRFLRRVSNSIRHRVGYYRKQLFPTEYERTKTAVQKSYEDGFAYHQSEVKKDPQLLEWVLREDYLGKNGELPIQSEGDKSEEWIFTPKVGLGSIVRT